MRFMPEPAEEEAARFIEGFLAALGEGCTPRMRIGKMAAITPLGQQLLRECAHRDIPVELID